MMEFTEPGSEYDRASKMRGHALLVGEKPVFGGGYPGSCRGCGWTITNRLRRVVVERHRAHKVEILRAEAAR